MKKYLVNLFILGILSYFTLSVNVTPAYAEDCSNKLSWDKFVCESENDWAAKVEAAKMTAKKTICSLTGICTSSAPAQPVVSCPQSDSPPYCDNTTGQGYHIDITPDSEGKCVSHVIAESCSKTSAAAGKACNKGDAKVCPNMGTCSDGRRVCATGHQYCLDDGSGWGACSEEVNSCNEAGCQTGGTTPGGGTPAASKSPQPAPANPAPAKTTCTPGAFKTAPETCTGKCAGCPADAGEANIIRCRADGSGFEGKGTECKAECIGPCKQAPQSPVPVQSPAQTPRSTPATGGSPSNSKPTSTPQPVTKYQLGTPTVQATGYYLSEQVIPNIPVPETRVDRFPFTISYRFKNTFSDPSIRTVFIRFFYSDGTHKDSQKSIFYTGSATTPRKCFGGTGTCAAYNGKVGNKTCTGYNSSGDAWCKANGSEWYCFSSCTSDSQTPTPTPTPTPNLAICLGICADENGKIGNQTYTGHWSNGDAWCKANTSNLYCWTSQVVPCPGSCGGANREGLSTDKDWNWTTSGDAWCKANASQWYCYVGTPKQGGGAGACPGTCADADGKNVGSNLTCTEWIQSGDAWCKAQPGKEWHCWTTSSCK